MGGIGGMEADLVAKAGIPFEAVPAAGVHSVGWRNLPRNLGQQLRGLFASRRILTRFRPEVMLFTGGFVAVPVALASWLPWLGFSRPRSLLYVPDIEPGLALKTLARFADIITLTTETSRRYFRPGAHLLVTGYPTRPELQTWERRPARQVLNLHPDQPVLLVFGGSKGSRSINRALLAVLPDLLSEMQVVHITGQLDWSEVQAARAALGASLPEDVLQRYHAYAYLHAEMGAALAAADLVVCRAGASTLGELPLFGLPAVLVPLAFAWRYQQVNAQYLAERGAAVVIQDAELAGQLLPTVQNLLRNPKKLAQMRSNMRTQAQPDAAHRIARQLLDLAGSGRGVA